MVNFFQKKFCIIYLFCFSIVLPEFAGLAQTSSEPSRPAPFLKMAPADPLSKIGAELAALAVQKSNNPTAIPTPQSNKGFTRHRLLQIQNNYVAIEAVAEPNQTPHLLADLKALGMIKPASYGLMVSGLIPIDKLNQVAALKNLHFARPAYKPVHKSGKITSQGDKAMYADSVRKKLSVTGKGSKIGVISDSYNSQGEAEDGVKAGELPGIGNPNGYTTPVQVLKDDPYIFNIDEGRAMMEIIHDVAPAAQLAFHTGFLGQANFAQGILDLQKAGCNIITDDVGYLNEPMFQDGIINQAIDEVVKRNVSYFTAAGNDGRLSYQAAFKNSGQEVIVEGVNYGVAHDFGNGDIKQKVRVSKNGLILTPFNWEDPFFSVSGLPGAQTDLDILLFYKGELQTEFSSFEKNIGNDPFEYIGFYIDDTEEDFEIAIVKHSGPDPKLMKLMYFGDVYPLEYSNTSNSTIYGHSNAAGAVSTGAVYWKNTPAYGATKLIAEDFSSVGGTPILLDAKGNHKTPEIRKKPEVMAPDGVSTSFFDFLYKGNEGFFGTSAAAPHAAAVAALMQESAGNSLSPNSIREAMQETAIDMNQPNFDFETGYGFLNALAAVGSVAKQRVLYLALVNASTGKEMQIIREGEVLNLTRLATTNVLLRAITGPEQVGSVVLELNGKKITENQTPYDYPGSANTNLKLIPGDYTLTATPYVKAQGQGETGIPLVVHFKAVEEEIVRFELIDVKANKVLQILTTGDILYLPDLPDKLNIRAITSPAKVGSVQFNLNGILTTENKLAYDLAGSSGGSINFTNALYTLSATTYPNEMAQGTAGDTKTIVFAAVNLSGEEANLANKQNRADRITVMPNPFTHQAKIKFSVPEAGNATLTIYNLNGAQVAVLHNGVAEPGKNYEYTLDGTSLPTGLYISRLVTKTGVLHRTLKLEK